MQCAVRAAQSVSPYRAVRNASLLLILHLLVLPPLIDVLHTACLYAEIRLSIKS